MKNKLRKAIALTLTFGIISSTAVMAQNEIKVYVDEKQVEFDVKPIIYEERTLVPLRAIFEALGAEVTWNQDTKTASAVRGDDTVSITIDSKQLFKNNKAVELDVPAMIVDERTLVPVRAISESFDCDVQWDGNSQSVNITTKTVPAPTAEPTVSPTEAPSADKGEKLQLSEKDNETLKSQKELIRYEYEQNTLPSYVFKNKDKIYDMLANTKEGIMQFGDTVFYEWDRTAITYLLRIVVDSETTYELREKETAENLPAYFEDAIKQAEIDKETMFEGATCLENDGTRVGVVIFKSADSLVQCKYLGIVAAKDKKPRYFTAENDVLETDKWFFCEVTESGRGTIGVFDKKDEQADFQNFVNIATEVYTKDTSAVVSINKN